jgi:parvulin-like peptidyl-prolyl isomerase
MMLRIPICLASLALLSGATAAQQPAAPVFATVGTKVISAADYDSAFAVAQRNRFYHRQAPVAEVEALKREVGDQLINRILLAEEAARRNIAPDRSRIDAQVQGYERRYGTSPQWPRMKAEMLPALIAELERRSVIERLEAQVREVGAPAEAVLRQFYAEHKDKFTEPERVKISVILLKVDPSSPKAAWEQAREEAASIRARLARGADFAELARLHSADGSAEKGGDMGYLHRGMLPEPVQDTVDKLAPGSLSEPITVLEGIALLRVDDRKVARQRDFDDVRERVEQLWRREAADKAFADFIGGLRAAAAVRVVDASRYPSASGSATAVKAN